MATEEDTTASGEQTQNVRPTAARGRSHGVDIGFAGVLHEEVTRIRETSGADIVALYPYDDETDTFYAPIAIGIPDADMAHALPDLEDQLRRFRADEAQGKIPDDLSFSSYGPSAWLMAMRRPLISTDAAHEVGSSFVRRNRVKIMIGLPLTVGSRIVGLLYLDYVERPGRKKSTNVESAAYLERIQEAASDMAITIDSARHAEEANILRTVGDLVGAFSSL